VGVDTAADDDSMVEDNSAVGDSEDNNNYCR